MSIRTIYHPEFVKFTPAYTNDISQHIGRFRLINSETREADYTIAAKCDQTTNNLQITLEREGKKQNVSLVNPFKDQKLSPHQIKELFNLPLFAIKVQNFGRSFIVTMELVNGLKGSGLFDFWRNSKEKKVETKVDTDEKAFLHEVRMPLPKPVLRPNFTLKDLTTTSDLAVALRDSQKGSAQFKQYEDMCYEVLNKYGKRAIVPPGMHQEVSAVSQSYHPTKVTRTIEVLLTKLSNNQLLDMEIVDALRNTLSFSLEANNESTETSNGSPRAAKKVITLSNDDLVKIMRVIAGKSKELHKQKATNPKLIKLLKTLSKATDTMADCRTEKLDFQNDYEPLKNALEELEKNEDWAVSTHAAYALQSLLRLTNSRTETEKHLHELILFLRAIDSTAAMVMGMRIGRLADLCKIFKEAANKAPDKERWYNKARLLGVLVEGKEWIVEKNHELVLDCFEGLKASETRNLLLYSIYFFLEIATEHTDIHMRNSAIRFLGTYLSEVKLWTSLGREKKLIQEALYKELDGLARSSNYSIHCQTVKTLQDIVNCALQSYRQKYKKHQELITHFKNHPLVRLNIVTINSNGEIDSVVKIQQNKTPDKAPIALCTELFDQVKEMHLNLDSFAQNKARELTSMEIPSGQSKLSPEKEELKRFLDTYYLPSYVEELDVEEGAKRLSLVDKVEEFKQNPEKMVLLIEANAGGGKTSFVKWLEYQMWVALSADATAPIPVLIPAAKLHTDTTEAIQDALLRMKFTPQHIAKIMSEKRSIVVIFDGYEELTQGGRRINLHTKNKIEQFNAKTIITCRSQFLADPNQYYKLFAAKVEGDYDRSTLEIISLREFQSDDRKAFLDLFTENNPQAPCKKQKYKGWNTKTYLDVIATIEGLSKILSNPYLLFITARVLPLLMEEKSKSPLIRNRLLGKYLDDWFERENGRSIDRNDENIGMDTNFIKHCYYYTTNLVAKWHSMDVSSINPEEDDWDLEFDREEEVWRRACPLVRLEATLSEGVDFSEDNKNCWIMDPLLKEYVVFLQIRDILLTKNSGTMRKSSGPALKHKFRPFGDENFTQKEIKEPSLLQFFVDELSTNSKLKTILENYRSTAPDSIAGKNSDRILMLCEKEKVERKSDN